MKNTENIIDTALQLFEIKLADSEIDNFLNIILTRNCEISISKSKELELFERLSAITPSYTFGLILQNAITKQSFSPKGLSEITNMSEEMLSKLLKDSILISNIPVLFVKRILLTLNISFQEAKSSILQTNLLLQNNLQNQQISLIGSPIFRKNNGGVDRNENLQRGNEFFENEEALVMYLERLEELMDE